jgi:treble-clef zinc-finger protein
MQPVGEPQIRASFINCSKGEAKRLAVPADLSRRPWADLDYLGWSDPGAPDRNYLVTERAGDLVGVVLRSASGAAAAAQNRRPGLCSICLTPQGGGGVLLMTAAKAGAAGRQGNSVGTLMCADLACSLYVRGKRKPTGGNTRLNENLTLEQQIERTRGNLFAFLANVTA